ncbi:MAG: S41 family peptidase [Rikenellaceae bacterium]
MPTIIAASIVVGMYLGLYISPNRTAPSKVARTAETKTSYLLKLIEHNYVDSVSINDIQEKIIPEILAELDPHSVYIPYEDMSDANEALDGKFDGIGVVFNMMTDTVVVLNVISGGPSFKAGIVAGDRIIKVDDKNIAGQSMPQDSVVKLLRGPRDTEVNLLIERSGVSSNMTIPVIRGVIPIKSLDAAFMIAPQVGFVKLSRFSRTSYKELIEALASFKQQGMTRLIFDLRGNSGGFLDQAIMIANEFLAANKLIVYTEDKNKRQTRQYSDGQGQFSDVELMMLIDEGSASSSEILSGAMQDNDRAMIIGRRSFGKGLVQEQVPFSDGSAVRLTVARYYTPTGRSIQKPYDNGSDKYEEEVLDRYMHDEFFNADSIKFDSTLRFTTPEGRIVYGGGGIMPDKFVPADSTRYSRNMQNILRENLIYRFALKFCDAHREQLNKIQTLSELDDFYKANDIYAEFVNYVRANSKGVNASSLSSDRKLLLPQLKAIVGRNTPLEDNAFYYYIAEIDDVLKVALQQE